jgi:hypothetical protein
MVDTASMPSIQLPAAYAALLVELSAPYAALLYVPYPYDTAHTAHPHRVHDVYLQVTRSL